MRAVYPCSRTVRRSIIFGVDFVASDSAANRCQSYISFAQRARFEPRHKKKETKMKSTKKTTFTWCCGERNTVSVRVCARHEHDARQLLWKTGRNTKLVLVSLQILYSQSFSTFSMLLFVKQNFSQHFVSFLLSPSWPLHVHCVSDASVHTSRMISHSCSPMFRFSLSILCSTYDRRTDFTSCLRCCRRWCDSRRTQPLHSFFMRASIIHRIQRKILFTS